MVFAGSHLFCWENKEVLLKFSDNYQVLRFISSLKIKSLTIDTISNS